MLENGPEVVLAARWRQVAFLASPIGSATEVFFLQFVELFCISFTRLRLFTNSDYVKFDQEAPQVENYNITELGDFEFMQVFC
jgi:hypothetical protein